MPERTPGRPPSNRPKKQQMNITLSPDDINALRDIANDETDGNMSRWFSQAIRNHPHSKMLAAIDKGEPIDDPFDV